MDLNVATHGTTLETKPFGDCTLNTWFRRTMHGTAGELCASIIKTERRCGEDGHTIKNTYCIASATSIVKWNEFEMPERHKQKVERMLSKNKAECSA